MAKFWSVFLAALQYTFSIYVFKKPDLTGCGPLISSLAVLLALSLVLWSLPLYPRRLRKLVSFANLFAQYLIAVFLIEYIMGCFWFPLETAILAFLPKLASTLEEILMRVDMRCNFPCDVLKMEGTGMFTSYLMSFLILVAALHATRMINLQLLSCGIRPFATDVTRRIQKFSKNLPLTSRMRIPRLRPRRSETCTSDEDFWPGDGEYEYVYK
ncbi:uncharacterized protein LOC123013954 [Tribolium madens]|uniref:uncharacterized protein LOC123013954 n=1 Tax=Tribolium madens TaxID=41895 RepID=UPI001CF760B0|nr:uncharacterized protein LOC123013954 [Tribolium madens]